MEGFVDSGWDGEGEGVGGGVVLAEADGGEVGEGLLEGGVVGG